MTAPKIIQDTAAATNYRKGRDVPKPDRIVIHVADGTFTGTRAWFRDKRAGVSAHFTVASDGQIAQSVNMNDTAFHAGNWAMNTRSVGIEHEGQPSRGPWTPTALQVEASAALCAYICAEYGIPADRAHIIGHNEVNPDRVARQNCPGPTWPWASFIALVQRKLRGDAPAHQPAPTDRRTLRLFSANTGEVIPIELTFITGTDKAYVDTDKLKAALNCS